MIHQSHSKGDEPADAGEDLTKVIRPLNKVAREDSELEPPEEQQFGKRNPRKMLDPKLPTPSEVEEHRLWGRQGGTALQTGIAGRPLT